MIEYRRLEIEGLDLLDGTPVLDIKPYVGEFDEPGEARFGWLEDARRRAAQSDDRFVADTSEGGSGKGVGRRE